MVLLFTAAIFVAAFLLFLIQPLAARLVLPHLGGSPAVWTGTMMFFQLMLLGGYGYAHVVGRMRPRVQGIVHGLVLGSCLLFVPLGLPAWWSTGQSGDSSMGPLLELLTGLASSVGVPFFAISSASPLIQSWFARTGHARANDPYFLYAASNAGSLMGLLAYPLAVEPALGLKGQGWAWTVGYAACAAMLVGCWLMAWRRSASLAGSAAANAAPAAKVSKGAKSTGRINRAKAIPAASAARAGAQTATGGAKQSSGRATPSAAVELSKGQLWRQRFVWMALAAAPSSLSLGVTQYLTTDVAAIPMLWVVPLAIYLATYVAAFSRFGVIAERMGRVGLPIAAVTVTTVLMLHAATPFWVIGPIHLVLLATGGLACHGRLSGLRPGADRLTEYYFMASLGGAIGGAFNSLVAPLIFDVVLEYPLAIAACCALLAIGGGVERRTRRRTKRASESGSATEAGHAGTHRPRRFSLLRGFVPVLLAVALTAGFLVAADAVVALYVFPHGEFALPGGIRLPARNMGQVLTVLVPCVAAFMLSGRRLVFAAIVGTLAGQVTLAPLSGADIRHDVLLVERTFFGVYAVADRPAILIREGEPEVPAVRIMHHGTTLHGRQWLDAARAQEPLSYYSRSGPVGDAFNQLFQRLGQQPARVGVIGLGVGSIAAYGRAGDEFDFFEIDPAVARIAQDPSIFTFLSACQARVRVVIGDGRLRMAREPAGRYDMIVLDAFSSDSIPVHLLTREAIEVYRARLKPGGCLLVHISNLHFDLLPPVARAARDVGMSVIQRRDLADQMFRLTSGSSDSNWLVLSEDREWLMTFAAMPAWEAIRPASGEAWTDDHADVLGAMRWD